MKFLFSFIGKFSYKQENRASFYTCHKLRQISYVCVNTVAWFLHQINCVQLTEYIVLLTLLSSGLCVWQHTKYFGLTKTRALKNFEYWGSWRLWIPLFYYKFKRTTIIKFANSREVQSIVINYFLENWINHFIKQCKAVVFNLYCLLPILYLLYLYLIIVL